MLICIGVTSKTLDCINWKLMWVCWTPWRVKCIVADVLSVSPLFFHSDEGLTLETSVNKNKIMLLHKLSLQLIQFDVLDLDKTYSGQDLLITRPTHSMNFASFPKLRASSAFSLDSSSFSEKLTNSVLVRYRPALTASYSCYFPFKIMKHNNNKNAIQIS